MRIYSLLLVCGLLIASLAFPKGRPKGKLKTARRPAAVNNNFKCNEPDYQKLVGLSLRTFPVWNGSQPIDLKKSKIWRLGGSLGQNKQSFNYLQVCGELVYALAKDLVDDKITDILKVKVAYDERLFDTQDLACQGERAPGSVLIALLPKRPGYVEPHKAWGIDANQKRFVERNVRGVKCHFADEGKDRR